MTSCDPERKQEELSGPGSEAMRGKDKMVQLTDPQKAHLVWGAGASVESIANTGFPDHKADPTQGLRATRRLYPSLW